MRKQINKNLLCSTGNSTQYSLLTYVEKESEKECAVLCLATQLCPTLFDTMICSPPGSSIHQIFQARILEWVAMPSSRGSSQPGDQTPVSHIAGGFFIFMKKNIYIYVTESLCCAPEMNSAL